MPRVKKIKHLDPYDKIWLKSGDKIYTGYVDSIKKSYFDEQLFLTVAYNQETCISRFRIEPRDSRTEVTEHNQTLYCNDPEEKVE